MYSASGVINIIIAELNQISDSDELDDMIADSEGVFDSEDDMIFILTSLIKIV